MLKTIDSYLEEFFFCKKSSRNEMRLREDIRVKEDSLFVCFLLDDCR